MFLPDDIINIILSFLSEFELVDWILIENLNWDRLSSNPAAIHLLEQNTDKIDWYWLCKNPAAIDLLEQNPKKINWYWLCQNSAAIPLLEHNKKKSIGILYLKIQLPFICWNKTKTK